MFSYSIESQCHTYLSNCIRRTRVLVIPELAKNSQPGGPFFRIHQSNDGKVMIFAGDIPGYNCKWWIRGTGPTVAEAGLSAF